MQLIIVTGMSGGGKSIAIRQLEDCGYYCIDNLPAAFLLPVAQDLRTHGIKSAAVAIDARSQSTFDGSLKAIRQLEEAGFDVRSAVIFALLLGITVLWKRVVHKDFSPILLILLSAALGVVLFGV